MGRHENVCSTLVARKGTLLKKILRGRPLILIEQGKINYHTFKPVLFEFPTYEYFVTGEKVGNCGKMN